MSAADDEWEVKITVYRKGRKFTVSDACGDVPTEALYLAVNDLELELQKWEEEEGHERG